MIEDDGIGLDVIATHDDCHQYTLFHFSFLLSFSHTSFRFHIFIHCFLLHSFILLSFLLIFFLPFFSHYILSSIYITIVHLFLTLAPKCFIRINSSLSQTRHMYNFSVSINYFLRSNFFLKNFLLGRSFILSYSLWCSEIFLSCKAQVCFAFFPSIFKLYHLFQPFCLYSVFHFCFIPSLHSLFTIPIPALSSISTATFSPLSSTTPPSSPLRYIHYTTHQE